MQGLKGKRILVTGGAGFIGSHLVEHLLDHKAKVVVIDNLVSGRIENLQEYLNKIEFIKKDICDERALDLALKGVDFVLHQAALRSVPKSVKDPFAYHEVNVSGTLRLLLKAKEKKIKRVVFASSSSVYGERTKFPEKETDTPSPVSPYATTKLACEYYLNLFGKLYNLETVSLRYFNVFGPRQALDDEYSVVIPKFITSLLKDSPPPIYGDGNQERDFTYIDNVVEANLLALIAPGISGEVFNVASGKPYSINQLFSLLKELLNKKIEPLYLAPRPGDVRKTHADIFKIKRVLGWRPKIDFKEGLIRTINWFKRQ